ncbi:MAG: NADPH-dependent glutamate synthase, partial [Dehalococcoidia bacterium]|nr:NADPH-dependent glutamate synthase [Dehalococcoidia bacterium]
MGTVNLDRQPMPAQDPQQRIKNFEEVALGYTMEQARAEASRCLQCKKPYCIDGCPVRDDIPAFIKSLREGDVSDASRIIKADNNLPAICGRVCPQESQCEARCVLAKKGAPIAIGRLERYIGDWELNWGDKKDGPRAKPSGKRIAIVGSGPAGVTCAADLARYGHEVTMFEALHAPGGVLYYGIPNFRLPKDIMKAEIDGVKALGVEISTDMVVGKTIALEELFGDGYSAVFLGTGAGLPNFQGIPGENLNGVYSANEFLTRTNLMKAYRFPEYDTPIKVGRRVAVIGAGNVAMDSVRCSIRYGVEEGRIVYRRSEEEMPARHEEVEHAREEGVIFNLLTAPTRIIGDDKGWVAGMECQKMELGEPDASGRRRPVPIQGSEFMVECETVIVAIGTSPNPLLPRSTA